MSKIEIAVIGATGVVGRQMLSELSSYDSKNFNVSAFASKQSVGKLVPYGDCQLVVQEWTSACLSRYNIVFLSAGSAFSTNNAAKIAEHGAVVIDNSSAWRLHHNVPLVVPQVNGHVINNFNHGIIANPNCAAIQLLLTLQPLQQFGLKEVIVSTYQSVSGAGQRGIRALRAQISDQPQQKNLGSSLFGAPIAYNIIPAIGKLDTLSACEEEAKIMRETKRILGDNNLIVAATAVRVPVFNCHCESVTVRLDSNILVEDIVAALQSSNALIVESNLPTPVTVDGSSLVHVARVRMNTGAANIVQYWSVADNLRVGAATNALNILRLLLHKVF